MVEQRVDEVHRAREADAVALAVIDHARHRPTMTLGVAAFSAALAASDLVSVQFCYEAAS